MRRLFRLRRGEAALDKVPNLGAGRVSGTCVIGLQWGDEAKGKCVGGNSCKGTSACNTATTSCAGQNACKGQGWIVTTKAECEEAGGTFEAS